MSHLTFKGNHPPLNGPFCLRRTSIVGDNAIAQRWCAISNQGAANCGFSTIDQCRSEVSGNGGRFMPERSGGAPPAFHRQVRPLKDSSMRCGSGEESRQSFLCRGSRATPVTGAPNAPTSARRPRLHGPVCPARARPERRGVLQGQDHQRDDRLLGRRRLRPLRPASGPAHRQAHPRQSGRGAAEHGRARGRGRPRTTRRRRRDGK